MNESGAYGETLRRTFRTEEAPTFVARTLHKSKIAVTEIRCDQENRGLTEPIPREDAFLITIQLRDVGRHGLFLDGKEVRTSFLPAGTTNIYDLRSSPIANSMSSFHHVSFYLPRPAMAEVAEREGLDVVDTFDQNPGEGVRDSVMHSLARALMPSFRTPETSDRLFVDHITIAATAHAVKLYAKNGRLHGVESHVLSNARLRIAKEQLSELGDQSPELVALADDMSPLGFAASFELSSGKSIHAWRADLRFERATRMIERGHELQEVAAATGYAGVRRLMADFKTRMGRAGDTFLRRHLRNGSDGD